MDKGIFPVFSRIRIRVTKKDRIRIRNTGIYYRLLPIKGCFLEKREKYPSHDFNFSVIYNSENPKFTIALAQKIYLDSINFE